MKLLALLAYYFSSIFFLVNYFSSILCDEFVGDDKLF